MRAEGEGERANWYEAEGERANGGDKAAAGPSGRASYTRPAWMNVIVVSPAVGPRGSAEQAAVVVVAVAVAVAVVGVGVAARPDEDEGEADIMICRRV